MLHWLVVSTPLKNMSQWEALSHILWKIKDAPNHQFRFNSFKYIIKPHRFYQKRSTHLFFDMFTVKSRTQPWELQKIKHVNPGFSLTSTPNGLIIWILTYSYV